jgi:hypothetical protein
MMEVKYRAKTGDSEREKEREERNVVGDLKDVQQTVEAHVLFGERWFHLLLASLYFCFYNGLMMKCSAVLKLCAS